MATDVKSKNPSPPAPDERDQPALPLPRDKASWLTLAGLIGLGIYHVTVKDMDGLLAVIVAGASIYKLQTTNSNHAKTLRVLKALTEETTEHLQDIRNNPVMPGTPVPPRDEPQ